MNETCIGCHQHPTVCECNLVEEFMEEQVWPASWEHDDLYNQMTENEFIGG